jgi:hypothetical protein
LCLLVTENDVYAAGGETTKYHLIEAGYSFPLLIVSDLLHFYKAIKVAHSISCYATTVYFFKRQTILK